MFTHMLQDMRRAGAALAGVFTDERHDYNAPCFSAPSLCQADDYPPASAFPLKPNSVPPKEAVMHHYSWKNTLLAVKRGVEPHDPAQHPDTKEEELIDEERAVQQRQQKKWDELNKGSFPASDPVARY